MIFDPLYLLLTLPALAFSIWAQVRVKSAFSRFSRIGLRSGMSGAEAARSIVRASGFDGVSVERDGALGDEVVGLGGARAGQEGGEEEGPTQHGWH